MNRSESDPFIPLKRRDTDSLTSAETPMFGWLMLGASVVIMYRVAEAEDRSPIGWAALTFALCYGSAMLIPMPFVNIFIGLAVSFIAMFALKIIQD